MALHEAQANRAEATQALHNNVSQPDPPPSYRQLPPALPPPSPAAPYDLPGHPRPAAASAAAPDPSPAARRGPVSPSGPPSAPSLDPVETPTAFDQLSISDTDREAADRVAWRFRHSRWVAKRERTLVALHDAKVSQERLERFQKCGRNAWVLVDKENDERFRLACFRCRDRFCDPCAAERRQTIAANLREQLPDARLRLLTLTIKARDWPLSDQIDFFLESFRKLRGRREIARRITGGLWFFELTLNGATRQWHPHLHVIAEGHFLPHQLLKNTWADVTGDSFIVDVRRLRDTNAAAAYVLKYATKGIGTSVWQDKDRYAEAIASLAGRRTFGAFGSWQKLSLSRVTTSPDAWEPVAPLHVLVADAERGDPEARRILAFLRRADANEPLDLHSHDPPRDRLSNLSDAALG